LSIFTLQHKFLLDVKEEMNAIIEESHHHLQVPSNYSDLLLQRYFGDQFEALKGAFGCSSETVKECNVAFDRFLTSYGWACNTRSALENLRNNDDYGPIYITQFDARSCSPDENGDFAKTCHCTDASFMYNQNFVVPRVAGHYSSDQVKYDDWRASDNTQSLLASTHNTWGTFFRTGSFPDGTIEDMNSMEFPNVNVVDETSSPYKQHETFEEECSSLDTALSGNYLNRGWDHIGDNFSHGAYKSFECDGTHCVLTTWDNTVFTGLDRGDVVDFRGIKYASAPSGDLRWRAPVMRTYGNEHVDATEWDNMCACHRCYSPQQEISQEDCLSVNIAVRKEALTNEEGVPIIYYYHGGGGNHGHNRYDAYDMVTEQNMMVISVAYRLGMFGFMYLPEIEEGQTYQSNFGIQDQIMAMKFSQKYGKIFGGNPAEAVISGSSSAGEAMWWLLTIPEAWPYFNKANVMCMGLNNANTAETASLARNTVLKVMNCETTDCLRQYTRVEIRDAANIAAGTARHSSTKIVLEPGFAPVVDGLLLRDHLYTLVSKMLTTWLPSKI
jgi:carboxylesterase type B